MKLLDNVVSANLMHLHLHLDSPLYHLLLKIPSQRLDWIHAKVRWCKVSASATVEYITTAKPSSTRKDSSYHTRSHTPRSSLRH